MNPRLLFPNTTLIKRYVVEQFIRASTLIYADHPVYTWAENDEQSKILIAPTYANTNQTGKRPKFLIQSGSYRFGLQDTFVNNFSEEMYDDETGAYLGKRHVKTVPTNLMILVQSYAEEESSDLADELTMLCMAQAAHVFDQHNISLIDVETSETNVLENDQETFQTVVSFQVQVIITIDDLPVRGLPVDVGTEIDVPGSPGLRDPGVEVYPETRFRE